MSIPVFTLESSRAPTELCILGAKCNADKSPFNQIGHRHPYTPFYSMVLAPYKNKPVRFAEIGVAGGASVHMWANYFRNSNRALYFFDRDEGFLTHSRNFAYPATVFGLMDIREADSVVKAFAETGGNLDVILDDSSHDVGDQKILVKAAFPYLKPGGLFLIEDIFRNASQEDYAQIIETVKDEVAFYAFIETEHVNKYSPGWDNDKILMIVKS